jgi:Dehydroquinase class II
VEVHLSNTASREEFRWHSVTASVCWGKIEGLGSAGLTLAVRALVERFQQSGSARNSQRAIAASTDCDLAIRQPIVGVMRDRMNFPNNTDVWLSDIASTEQPQRVSVRSLDVFGLLQKRATRAQAQVESTDIARELARCWRATAGRSACSAAS